MGLGLRARLNTRNSRCEENPIPAGRHQPNERSGDEPSPLRSLEGSDPLDDIGIRLPEARGGDTLGISCVYGSRINSFAASWTARTKACTIGVGEPGCSTPKSTGSKSSSGSRRTWGWYFIFGTPTITPMP
jgi:hypothetical protein